MFDLSDYRVSPGAKVDLDTRPTRIDAKVDGKKSKDQQRKLTKRLQALQELLYADGSRALLVVLQAMDAGGKDSTIRHVFGPINPQGCRVTSFKAPGAHELAHDYLWRIHQQTPPRGMIGVFNRSHYEDIVAVRVRRLAPPEVWKKRYDHINAFERLLVDEGTEVIKLYLHISKDYQAQRFQRRLAQPDKHWKFNPADLDDRERWGDFRDAFEDVLRKCSTDHAPWHVVPAEDRRLRDLLVTQIVVEALERMNLQYPAPDFDPGDNAMKLQLPDNKE